MYTPNNTTVYLRAVAGCLAGMAAGGRYLTDTTPGDYTGYAQAADAYGQAVDGAFGVTVPTAFQLELIQEISQSVWGGRSGLPSAGALAGSYTGIGRAVAALAIEGNAQVVSEGVNPNVGSATALVNRVSTPSAGSAISPLTPGGAGAIAAVMDFTPSVGGSGKVLAGYAITGATSGNDTLPMAIFSVESLTAITGGTSVPGFPGLTLEPTSITPAPSGAPAFLQEPNSVGASAFSGAAAGVLTLTPGARCGLVILLASLGNRSLSNLTIWCFAMELP